MLFSTMSTHVVIIAVVTRVARNVNKFYVYVLSIPLFMLSNIADTVNKHKMTMAGVNVDMYRTVYKILKMHI